MNDSAFNWKHFALYAFIVPTLAILVYALLIKPNSSSVLLMGVVMYAGVPMLAMGVYMWVTGGGYRWMNIGVDWRSLSESDTRKSASHAGLFFAMGSLFFMYAIALIATSIMLFIVLIVVSLILFMMPVRLMSEKYRNKLKDLPAVSSKKTWAPLMAVTVVAVVPCGYMLMDTVTGVSVEYDDYRIVITAPMFKATLDRSKISEHSYVDVFTKGSRVNGFADGTMCTGTFNNNLYGNYQLAAFAKVSPCITLKCDGTYYAFNQSTPEATAALFDAIFK